MTHFESPQPQENPEKRVKINEKLLSWLQENVVGKKAEFRGYHFQGPGPKYRATVTGLEVKEFVGGPQYVMDVNSAGDIEKYNEETEEWEKQSNLTVSHMWHVGGANELVVKDGIAKFGGVELQIPEELLKE